MAFSESVWERGILPSIKASQFVRVNSSCAVGEIPGWSAWIDDNPEHMEQFAEELTNKGYRPEYGWNFCHKLLVGTYGRTPNSVYRDVTPELVHALERRGWKCMYGGHAPHGDYNIFLALHIPEKYEANSVASKKPG